MAFDKMVEKAAFAPRRFGLAPKTVDIFPTEAVSWRHLAESHLAESHLADSHLAESHLAKRNLAESHLAESSLAESHLAKSHLAESHWTSVTLRHLAECQPLSFGHLNKLPFSQLLITLFIGQTDRMFESIDVRITV